MATFRTQGVCAKNISYEVKDGKVSNVSFDSGCPGNLQALSKLVEGMEVNQVIEKLDGIRCGYKSTSCADQLCRALETL